MLVHSKGWVGFVALLLQACASPSPPLPGGYSVEYGDRGKAWLANPDGTIAHAALIEELYSDDSHILLVSFAVTYDGKVDGPRPLDGNCYIALMIDTRSRQTRQVRLSEAKRLASKMSSLESYDRGCLQGMPTA